MRQRRSINKAALFVWLVALLVLVGRAAWEWHASDVPVVESTHALPDLPSGVSRIGDELLQAILVRDLFDPSRGRIPEPAAPAGQQGDKPEDVHWRLLATVLQSGQSPAVVVEIAGEIKVLRQGEWLPGGARLTRILPDGIEITSNGVDRHIFLFGKQAAEQAE